MFWVPAGVAAIYAVKNAGLAISQGVWSSIIVLVSFIWGIGVFEEKVRSKLGACVAVLIMVAGLWGMSFFSSPVLDDNVVQQQGSPYRDNPYSDDCPIEEEEEVQDEELEEPMNAATSLDYEGIDVTDDEFNDDPQVLNSQQLTMKRRRMGLAAAVFNGVWGGSIMVPMHFAPPEASGTGYVTSFAIGASIMTILLWILRFGYHMYETNMSLTRSYNSLPPLHLKIMWLPGGIAGTLWSVGNIASMISVQNLGEGVGYSLTQASMLCSGVWGIFYFNEVVSRVMRVKWFVSAIITVVGILLLSYEHQK